MSDEVLSPGIALADPETRLYRRVTWRLVPILFAAHVAAYLDRVNVGFAKLQMLRDLGFSETVHGLGTGVTDPFAIGLLTAFPCACAALGMVLCGRLSDARRERRWHIVVPGLVGVLGWLVAVQHPHDVMVAEIAFTVATTGVLVALAQFWTLPTALLAGAAAASGIAVVNSVGNLAGFVSPYLIGWIIDATRSTSLGVYTLAGCLLAGSLLSLAMPARLVNR